MSKRIPWRWIGWLISTAGFVVWWFDHYARRETMLGLVGLLICGTHVVVKGGLELAAHIDERARRSRSGKKSTD